MQKRLYREVMNKALITILLLLLNGLCFGISPNTTSCAFYYPGGTHKDSDIKSLLLKINKYKAVKVCGEHSSERAVYTASKVNKVGDVSYYQLTRVFKKSGGSGTPVSYTHLTLPTIYSV